MTDSIGAADRPTVDGVEPATPESFRRRFPIFESKIFLNSCSKGALSREVEDAYAEYLSSWRTKGSPWDDWVETLEAARAGFATLVGCDPDEIAVTFCASTAAAGLLSALSFPEERNVILVGDFEFPTMVHNWLAQQKRGARIERVRASSDRLSAAAYEEKLLELGDRVAFVPVEHVCFRNGHRRDAGAVARAARAAGALSLVDDYQSTGTRPLDVRELGCDVLVTGALKYLLGSSGLGWMYVRRERVAELEPVMTGWFGQERPFDFDVERATYHASARRFETGTPPVPSLHAGLAGLSLIREVGLEAIGAHVDSLAAYAIARAGALGLRVITPEEPAARGPLVVLRANDAERVVSELGREGVIVSSRGQGLRVSFHYYNVQEDIDTLFEVLDRVDRDGKLMEREDKRR